MPKGDGHLHVDRKGARGGRGEREGDRHSWTPAHVGPYPFISGAIGGLFATCLSVSEPSDADARLRRVPCVISW